LDADLTKTSRCAGVPPNNWSFRNAKDSLNLGRWIQNDLSKYWNKEPAFTARTPRSGSLKPFLALAVLADASKVKLNGLGNQQIVMARIRARDVGGAIDDRYGISYTPDMTEFFYIVFNGWQQGPTQELPRRVRSADYLIGSWTVYGVRKHADATYAVVAGESGTFGLCVHPHDAADKKDGARFTSCIGAEQTYQMQRNDVVRDALQGRPLFQALAEASKPKLLNAISIDTAFQRLVGPAHSVAKPPFKTFLAQIRSILADEPNAPAWMTCGGGCCTADF
jgi:hypothetical protein